MRPLKGRAKGQHLYKVPYFLLDYRMGLVRLVARAFSASLLALIAAAVLLAMRISSLRRRSHPAQGIKDRRS